MSAPKTAMFAWDQSTDFNEFDFHHQQQLQHWETNDKQIEIFITLHSEPENR